MSSLLFTIIKNDNQWLDEWVRYHLAIGFSHILIYDNNDGKNDYPMSDYIIEQCTLKKITVINKRNMSLNRNAEFKNLNTQYDYSVMLRADEFLKFNDKNMTIDVFLNDINSGLYINVIPYDIIGENEKINLKKYETYLPIYLKKKNCQEIKNTNDIFVMKIISIK